MVTRQGEPMQLLVHARMGGVVSSGRLTGAIKGTPDGSFAAYPRHVDD
jgi:hypothetical protein